MLHLVASWKTKQSKVVWGALALWLTIGASFLEPFSAHAVDPDGAVDPTFLSGSGPNGNVYALALQPDGKVLIGGDFTTFNVTARNRIARLNTDGSLDTSFDPGSGANGNVYAIAVQADGKVLIAGDFTTYNGFLRNYIARLNADGTLDVSFLNIGFGANASVSALAVQPDGKVLIGGNFTTYNGTARNRIARLNADSTLDASFLNIGSGSSNYVRAIALQPDGKVLIGGGFLSYNGTARNRIARLNADGSLDLGFNPGSGANSTLYTLALQPDGNVLIGGGFTTFNVTARNRIARLNTDGALDASFLNVGSGANASVYAIAVQPDGKVLIAGSFTSYNGTARNRIARLNTDGTLDASFLNTPTGANGTLYALAVQPDGKVLIGGGFATNRNRIARLNANGALDAFFLNTPTGANGSVKAIAVQSDGKVLIGGDFTTYNGFSRNRIARLNADGTFDITFKGAAVGPDNSVRAIAVQADGKVLIAGDFTTYNGTARNRIARLNTDGSLDASFLNVGSGANASVRAIAVQPDGKVLIAGSFTSYNGVGRNYIARLNADGSLDLGFNPGSGANSVVEAIALQPDGKVLIGGGFTSYNGTARNRIARLNANGSLDLGFNPGSGANSTVYALALQPDGNVLIAGSFTTYDGVGRAYTARLNANGALDLGFNDGTNNIVVGIAVQADGKVLIAGWFTFYNGVGRNGIARLNADGSLDTDFNPGFGANDHVNALAMQSDGKVLIGGLFGSVDTSTRDRIARLENTVQ
jgi:uncharacterized delta-60 repeat protein